MCLCNLNAMSQFYIIKLNIITRMSLSLCSLTGPFLLISWPILPEHCYLKKCGPANVSKPLGPITITFYYINSTQKILQTILINHKNTVTVNIICGLIVSVPKRLTKKWPNFPDITISFPYSPFSVDFALFH